MTCALKPRHPELGTLSHPPPSKDSKRPGYRNKIYCVCTRSSQIRPFPKHESHPVPFNLPYTHPAVIGADEP